MNVEDLSKLSKLIEEITLITLKSENDVAKISTGIVIPTTFEQLNDANVRTVQIVNIENRRLTPSGKPTTLTDNEFRRLLSTSVIIVTVNTVDGKEVPVLFIVDRNRCQQEMHPSYCRGIVAIKVIYDLLPPSAIPEIVSVLKGYEQGTKADILKLPPDIKLMLYKKYAEAPPTVLRYKKIVNLDAVEEGSEDAPLLLVLGDGAYHLKDGQYIECCGLKSIVKNGKLNPAIKYEIKWRPENKSVWIEATVLGYLRITGVYRLSEKKQYTFKPGYEVEWGPIVANITINAEELADGKVKAGYNISIGIPCGDIEPGLVIFHNNKPYEFARVLHNNIAIKLNYYECNQPIAPCMGNYKISKDEGTLNALKQIINMAKIKGNEFDVNKILLTVNKIIANILSTLSVPTTHEYHKGIVEYILENRKEIIDRSVSMLYYS